MRLALAVLAGIALAAPFSGGVAQASPGVEPTPQLIAAFKNPQVVEALKRLDQGGYTDSDLKLIRSYPDLARIVPDPTRPPEVTIEAPSKPVQPRGNSGPLVDDSAEAKAAYTQYSAFGNKIYTWHYRVVFNYSWPNITRWFIRDDYLTDRDSVVQIRDLTTDWASAVPAPTGETARTRHLEYCVLKIGCYANTYPHAHFSMTGGGWWTVVDGGAK